MKRSLLILCLVLSFSAQARLGDEGNFELELDGAARALVQATLRPLTDEQRAKARERLAPILARLSEDRGVASDAYIAQLTQAYRAARQAQTTLYDDRGVDAATRRRYDEMQEEDAFRALQLGAELERVTRARE